MKESSNRLLAAAVLAMGFGFGTPAHAQDWNAVGQFGWFAVGKAWCVCTKPVNDVSTYGATVARVPVTRV